MQYQKTVDFSTKIKNKKGHFLMIKGKFKTKFKIIINTVC